MADHPEADRLKELWRDAARIESPAAEGVTAQVLALGVNFRVDLMKALKAAVETVQAVIKRTAAIHSSDPLTWAEGGRHSDKIPVIRVAFGVALEGA
jgi:hypothetical protein